MTTRCQLRSLFRTQKCVDNGLVLQKLRPVLLQLIQFSRQKPPVLPLLPEVEKVNLLYC